MSTISSPGMANTIPNLCIRDEQSDSYMDIDEENGLWPTLCTFVALFLLTLLYSGFVTFIKVGFLPPPSQPSLLGAWKVLFQRHPETRQHSWSGWDRARGYTYNWRGHGHCPASGSYSSSWALLCFSDQSPYMTPGFSGR